MDMEEALRYCADKADAVAIVAAFGEERVVRIDFGISALEAISIIARYAAAEEEQDAKQ